MLARTCPSSHPQESSLMLSGILSRLYLHPSTGPRRYGRLLSTYVEWVCRSGMWRTVSVAHALSVCCTRCSQRTVTQHGTTNHAFDQPQLYPQARPRLGPVQRENYGMCALDRSAVRLGQHSIAHACVRSINQLTRSRSPYALIGLYFCTTWRPATPIPAKVLKRGVNITPCSRK